MHYNVITNNDLNTYFKDFSELGRWDFRNEKKSSKIERITRGFIRVLEYDFKKLYTEGLKDLSSCTISNETVYKNIFDKIMDKTDVDIEFNNCIFPDIIKINNIELKNCSIIFNDCIIENGVDLNNVKLFDSRLSFNNSIIKKTVSVEKITVFEGSSFSLEGSIVDFIYLKELVNNGKIFLNVMYALELKIYDLINNLLIELRYFNNEFNEFYFENSRINKHYTIINSIYIKNMINSGYIQAYTAKGKLLRAIQKAYDLPEKNGVLKYYKKNELKNSSDYLSTLLMFENNFSRLGYERESREIFVAKQAFICSGKVSFRTKVFHRPLLIFGKCGTHITSIILGIMITLLVFSGIYFFYYDGLSVLENGDCFIDKIINSIYFSSITFLTVGFGDVTPITKGLKIIATIEGFIGVVMIAYLTATIVRRISGKY